jgi:hypothetical protein
MHAPNPSQSGETDPLEFYNVMMETLIGIRAMDLPKPPRIPLPKIGPSFDDLHKASENPLAGKMDIPLSRRPEVQNLRQAYVEQWSWGYRPTKEGFVQIAKFISRTGAPALEIGSGSGLWGELYYRLCLEHMPTAQPWICTDPNKWQDTFSGIHRFDAKQAVAHFTKCQTLIFIWPDNGAPYAYEALKVFKGNQMIYVGENSRGCTADKQFHTLVATEWVLTGEVPIVRWIGVRDKCLLFVRK